MFHDSPSEIHVGEKPCVGMSLGDSHRVGDVEASGVGVLHKQTACDSHILAAAFTALFHLHLEQAEVLLLGENLKSLVGKRRSHHNLKEDRLHLESHLAGDGAVERHDTAVDAHLVGLVCTCPCVEHVCTDSRATRVHVLQTYAERFAELAHDLKSRVGILDIVVRKFLALELACGSHAV